MRSAQRSVKKEARNEMKPIKNEFVQKKFQRFLKEKKIADLITKKYFRYWVFRNNGIKSQSKGKFKTNIFTRDIDANVDFLIKHLNPGGQKIVLQDNKQIQTEADHISKECDASNSTEHIVISTEKVIFESPIQDVNSIRDIYIGNQKLQTEEILDDNISLSIDVIENRVEISESFSNPDVKIKPYVIKDKTSLEGELNENGEDLVAISDIENNVLINSLSFESYPVHDEISSSLFEVTVYEEEDIEDCFSSSRIEECDFQGVSDGSDGVASSIEESTVPKCISIDVFEKNDDIEFTKEPPKRKYTSGFNDLFA